MEVKATGKYIRISPHKVRRVVNLIRGRNIGEAMSILKFSPQRSSVAVEKVLRSAIANAETNYEMDLSKLFVARAYVDEGPTWRRFRPRAMGRADLKRRRTAHITVILGEKEA